MLFERRVLDQVVGDHIDLDGQGAGVKQCPQAVDGGLVDWAVDHEVDIGIVAEFSGRAGAEQAHPVDLPCVEA